MLTLYHTNDMHGSERALKALDDELRGQKDGRPLLLDSGDAISGSNTAFQRHEQNLVTMSELGYAAMAMGNREFHYLRSVHRLRARERNFPILAANLVDLRGADQWQSHLVLEHQGYTVGVFGAIVVQYPVGSNWEKLFGFRFLDPEKCLPPLAQRLRKNCDLVVFLSHLGLDVDRRLTPSLSVDLVLGGHTHDTLEEPERAGDAWILQGGSHGRHLGRLQLEKKKERWQLDYQLLAC